MGLFGFGKEEKKVKITDFFSEEDLATIKEQAEGSLSGGAVVELLANGLLNYVKNPEKEYSYSNFNKFVKIADSFKNMDPYLAPILTKGIEKYKAAK